jgi:hypothetical protein
LLSKNMMLCKIDPSAKYFQEHRRQCLVSNVA